MMQVRKRSQHGFLIKRVAWTQPESYFAQGPWFGGAGVSPAVLRRDGSAGIASGTLAPPNPTQRGRVCGCRSTYSNISEKPELGRKAARATRRAPARNSERWP